MSEKFSFQAEIQKVLDLMIHSVYSNKEVFLRELVANASDAIDKRKYVALSKTDLAANNNEYFIQIIPDTNARTLKIIDNGIGMTKEEVIENIGTIAKSGTKQFVEMARQLKENPELIGQFGVGFYSTFMVADKVQVVTKPATGEAASLWESTGDGTYTITAADKSDVGTEITLHLKPAEKNEEDELEEFSEEYTLKKIIQKYSDFIPHPIQLLTTKYEYDKDGKVIPGKTKQEFETANSQKALWTRQPSEVSKEEYTE
ncbi:MAG: ATP-binding protein, partial [Bdellovibrionales bacterium]|nr:ATP-binding protein [Bdellovibrionales bacterium]